MGILRGPEDNYVKEMAKWEQNLVIINGTPIQPIPFSEGGRGGMPRQEYPKMLYKADSFDGGPRISGTHLVHDEGQERIAIGQGWSVRQEDALSDVGRRHLENAKLAAERAATERWMSDAARAEAAAVDESTIEHVPVIPVTPIRAKGTKVDVK